MFKTPNRKIIFLTACVVIFGALLVFNVLLIDVKGLHWHSGTDLNNYNGISYVKEELIPATRGKIYDSNNNLVAEDVDAWDIIAYISPNRPGNNKGVYYVKDKEGTAKILAEMLNADYDSIYALLTRDSFMTYLGTAGRGISTMKKEEIQALHLPGIEFSKVSDRNYPMTPYSSHLIGFAGYTYREDGGNNAIQGKAGLEISLDKYLTGTPGYQSYYKDTAGNPLVGMQTEYVSARNGNDVYLTLDDRIQTALQKCLEQSYKKGTKTKMAWGIVMEGKTGRILGYDTYPTYDQNDVNVKDYMDYNAMATYEPASIMKTITYAAAIDQGKFSPDDTFNGNYYYMKTDGKGNIIRANANNYTWLIKNFDGGKYGTMNFWNGYAVSVNAGAITLVEKYVTPAAYREYLHNFGLFQPVKVFGITNESEGVENTTHPRDLASTTFGQASSVTSLQIVQAYSAFCNEGKMVKPYIVDKIVDNYTGETIYQAETEVVGQPIKASSAQTILDMMEYTVRETVHKPAHRYYIEGIRIGGKTGTGDEVGPNGTYNGLTLHSIMLIISIDKNPIILYTNYMDYNNYASNGDYVEELEKTICEVLGLYTVEEKIDDQDMSKQLYSEAMPELLNHTAAYADKKLAPYELNVIKIGTGNMVMKQYPVAGTSLLTGQRVMLLMNTEGLKMPNMKGWSRKDVTGFWELTGIEVTLSGNGYVTDQNIPPGDNIDSTSKIEVTLQ